MEAWLALVPAGAWRTAKGSEVPKKTMAAKTMAAT